MYVLMLLAAATLFAPLSAVASEDGYRLVWSDEFDQEGPPNPENWIYETGFVRNLEDQYYQPQNARCEKGLLIIEGRREKRANDLYDAGSSDWRRNRREAAYTSASLKTCGKHSWLYGRFQMRARIPVASGMWPAFWALGDARSWPSNGEIDIMEYYRQMVLANLIWKGSNISARHHLASFGPGWAEQFHTWQMDWEPGRITIRVDDRLLLDVPVEHLANADADRANAYREPHYLLVNLAIGGNQGGRPSEGTADPSSTDFPVRFEVDYIRVYQRGKK